MTEPDRGDLDWIAEVDDAAWALSPGGTRDLSDAVDAIAARLDRADSLMIEADDGTVYAHDQLLGVGRDAVERARTALERDRFDEGSMAELVGALNDLHVIAVAVALADPAASDDHGAVALADYFSRKLADAWGALEGSVVPIGSGRFRLRWRAADRRMVAALATDLDQLLESDDESVVRLFPPAYGTDETKSREWAALARDELVTSRRASLATLESALGRTEVDAEELHALMRSINDLRLVVGTKLDVSEDDDQRPPVSDPRFQSWLAYHRLGRMLAQILAALND